MSDCSLDLLPADVKTSPRTFQKSAYLTSSNFMDSTDRNYFMKLWTRFSIKKTPVEENSMERQYEAARQALMGKTPPHFTFLFQRGSVPAPLNNTYYASVSELQKVFEVCEESSKIPSGYGKSNKDTHAGKYSALFQSCPWLKDLPFKPPEIRDIKEDWTLKAPQKMSLQFEKGALQHRRHTISLISHPGSNTKPILPPIPQGRKYTST